MGAYEFKKKQKKPSVGVELRAFGDPRISKKPRWSASDMNQLPKTMHRYPVSPKRVLQVFFDDLNNYLNIAYMLNIN